MKNKSVLLVSGVALLIVAMLGLGVLLVSQGAEGKAQAQTTPPAAPDGYSGISVSGTGRVLVTPDVVRFNIGIETRAATVADAQKQSADSSQKLTDALKKAGIKPEDIQTSNYSIYPDYITGPNQAPKLNGYVINNTLAVVVRDVSKAGEVLDAAGAAGANQISNITFAKENNADALKQARTAAMNDAFQKAQQLAAAGKVSVGSVIKIVENTSSQPPTPLRDAVGAAPSAAVTQIESGQYQVTVDVQVTYAIGK